MLIEEDEWIGELHKGSMKSRTSFMVGRSFGFSLRQCNANDATFFAPLSEYCPSSFWSIMRSSLCLLVKKGMAHSTKCFSWLGLFSSTAFRPVNISKSTTPYPYTSLFGVNRPDTLHATHLLDYHIKKDKHTLIILIILFIF